MMAIFVMLGGAWNILSGYAGQLSLGHAAFFGTGAYVSTLLVNAYGISPWITLWIGGASRRCCSACPWASSASACKGRISPSRPSAWRRPCACSVLHFREITNGAQGLTVPFKGNAPWLLQFDSKLPYYYIALALAIAVLLDHAADGAVPAGALPGGHRAEPGSGGGAGDRLGARPSGGRWRSPPSSRAWGASSTPSTPT